MALATAIGTGGAIGRSIVAGEAAIVGAAERLYTEGITGIGTGAVRGVASAGHSIMGASVGGGVSAAVNNAIGNNSISSHFVSGIAGCVADRHAVNRYANRNRHPVIPQTEPLLGNRLGGRPNVNRFVPSRTVEP